MKIFETLIKYQKRRNDFAKSDDVTYFMAHRDNLNKFPKFSYLFDSKEEFDIFRANIILKGLENKQCFEKEIENAKDLAKYNSKGSMIKFHSLIKERTVELPYYQENKTKIFVPFFSRAINLLYSNEPEVFLSFPYKDLANEFIMASVDPFDTYGSELFNSHLTRLIKVATNGRETLFFHYDTNTIYVVNDEGRLDHKIVLFDKYIDNIDNTNMLERIRNLSAPYFANNRAEFVEKLYENSFISQKMYLMLKEPK